ncbi:hypothetical protein AB1207_01200 [Kineococcus endophyticus]|uniref:Uncharacterized protein n=1 Tax=Kineococcus endophyticus TaxID=1181883 RepID=A0ABV3P264_9ACTN
MSKVLVTHAWTSNGAGVVDYDPDLVDESEGPEGPYGEALAAARARELFERNLAAYDGQRGRQTVRALQACFR